MVAATDLSDELKKYTMEKTGNRIYSRPKTMFSKTTSLPPVEPPHPGTSYNPTFQDHQDLLQKAWQTEVKEITAEAKTRRQLGPMLKVTPVQKQVRFVGKLSIDSIIGYNCFLQAEWFTEMSQGLADDDEDKEAEEGTSIARPTKPKTRKQKLKAKALRYQEFRRKQLKEEKRRLAEFMRLVTILLFFEFALVIIIVTFALFSLRSIRREIRVGEEKQAARIVKRKEEKVAKLSKPAILGRCKYEELPVEVNMSDEIAGSLRGLKTEGMTLTSYINCTQILTVYKCSGNVLIDRYKSLQRRNIIEPRIRHRTVYRYKHKVFKKRSHVEPTGYKICRKQDQEKEKSSIEL